MGIFAKLLSSGDFMPHGYCYLWDRRLVLLHLVSDALIALAYFSISFALVYFVRKRRDLPFDWMFVSFGVFIAACGSTHVMEVWTLWHANYWLSGIIKATTALASVPTAILLMQLVPKALALPSPDELKAINCNLADRTGQLDRANRELETANIALRQSEERYRSLFDSNPHPTWVFDLETLVFLDVNQSAVRSYGYSLADFASLTIRDIRPEEDTPPLLEFLSATPRTAETKGVWRHRRKDGTLMDVEVTSHPLVFGDRDARLVVATDITERKRAEEALEQQRRDLVQSNAELAAANTELEAFSYAVSHDLRAPLRAIDGFGLALLEDCSDKLGADGRDEVRRIRAAAQRMNVLINDLLDLSRVARAAIRPETVNLTAIAHSIAAELRKAQPGRRVEFRIAEQLLTSGDSRLLSIALENLLGNAWKFTSKRESACIEFGRMELTGGPAYFVRDDGAGFDPAGAGRLFGAFQRLHEDREFPGTGIGLATVRRIIHRHGGRIWAEGAPERGATFYFTLALMEHRRTERE
ncbi:MAG TPA: PAS domain S-box protein [Candidatus Acidoferrum sp.]